MVSANKIEILRIAETVAQEKMIDKAIVITTLEEAIAKAAKSNYAVMCVWRTNADRRKMCVI